MVQTFKNNDSLKSILQSTGSPSDESRGVDMIEFCLITWNGVVIFLEWINIKLTLVKEITEVRGTLPLSRFRTR